ncbi:uncharacterized protein B0H18DRAFT_954784 [Fomitopsis serialis]|uniref:uncharacterized protein n=1 Tax=Fomitopsis serialis TaxID=139415 RepID=UPI0020085356|nr:uncharacterized protein B0H18DRAFT_954784 [Neoantrodia serialis]KAH9926104.1 hypothetical protein B0H18DRAFT_954784 [Neoantrodia serialis]
MFPLPLIAALLPGAVLAGQQPFVGPHRSAHDIRSPLALDNSSAPFIFNSLSGLLQQWPNTYHWNGHTIVPGTLESFTLLYHARRDADIPDTEEWFAFDPEMSYGIMGGRGFTFMLTYQTLRPAKIIYVDGMSAALSDSGWLDSQEVILSRKGKGGNSPMEGGGVFGEDRRLKELCKWARKFDVEGIVRMNAGFELMWCDFESPFIQLVSYLNITAPGTPYSNGSDFPRWPGGPGRGPGRPPENNRLVPADPDPPKGDPPRRGPGRDPHGGPFSGMPSPFASTSFPEWLRAATARNVSPQPHVTLDYASFVTFYNPRYQSLIRARATQKGMREHRAWLNISDEDAAAIVQEVEDVLSRPAGEGSGMNWGALAQDVVEEWAGRTMQLKEFLDKVSKDESLNATETVLAVRRLAYSPLNPYMDTTSAQNSTAWGSFFEADPTSLGWSAQVATPWMNTSALERCKYAATSVTYNPRVRLTSQEMLLRASVETVLSRLCSDYGSVFMESMDADEHASADATTALIASWESRIVALMQWLDWTEWLRCGEVCTSDSICSMPLWPVSMWMGIGGGMPHGPGRDRGGSDNPEAWTPRCVPLRVQQFRWPPGRNVDLELLLAARHVL